MTSHTGSPEDESGLFPPGGFNVHILFSSILQETIEISHMMSDILFIVQN